MLFVDIVNGLSFIFYIPRLPSAKIEKKIDDWIWEKAQTLYLRMQAAEEEAKRKAAAEKAADEAKRKVSGGDLQPPTPLPSRSV